MSFTIEASQRPMTPCGMVRLNSNLTSRFFASLMAFSIATGTSRALP
jgi:hypothetical protein